MIILDELPESRLDYFSSAESSWEEMHRLQSGDGGGSLSNTQRLSSSRLSAALIHANNYESDDGACGSSSL